MKTYCPECGTKMEYIAKKPKFCSNCGYAFAGASKPKPSYQESIETEEENILLKDVSDAEVNDFIESLNTQQFSKVREYVENMPRVEKQIKFICGGCEKENNITLSGIDDFF